jgi:membrane-associated phospholipid phosphatase
LAEILKSGPLPADTRFWPVDKVVLVYYTFGVAVILGWWTRLPSAPWLLLGHAVLTSLLLWEIKRPNRTSRIFRNWYPVAYVSVCYKEMALFIPAIRRTDFGDQLLARLDFGFWHTNPTIWLERIYNPFLTEYLQWAYTLFVPAVLLVAYLLWQQGKYQEFQYYAFLIAMGFMVSYLGYLVIPARGPRFLLRYLEHVPLQGLWLFQGLQSTLDKLESAHYDCFPSGHTELTILALWGSRLVSRRLFRFYFAYTPCLIFATVYLRYHYTVDLLAGIATALVLICVCPTVYRKLQEGI